MSQRFILASRSPRRQMLLKQLIPGFECQTSNVEELLDDPGGPAMLAEANARLKALDIAKLHPDAWVLGSDTVVAIEGKSLGKPSDTQNAFEMIRNLSGKEHDVISGVCLTNPSRGICEVFSELSKVCFFNLTDEEIQNYVNALDTTQFAGGYPIQCILGSLVSGFQGSYSNIVGLPVEALEKVLVELQLMDAS